MESYQAMHFLKIDDPQIIAGAYFKAISLEEIKVSEIITGKIRVRLYRNNNIRYAHAHTHTHI